MLPRSPGRSCHPDLLARVSHAHHRGHECIWGPSARTYLSWHRRRPTNFRGLHIGQTGESRCSRHTRGSSRSVLRPVFRRCLVRCGTEISYCLMAAGTESRPRRPKEGRARAVSFRNPPFCTTGAHRPPRHPSWTMYRPSVRPQTPSHKGPGWACTLLGPCHPVRGAIAGRGVCSRRTNTFLQRQSGPPRPTCLHSSSSNRLAARSEPH